jgi:glycine hydroxymethyltransferase
MSDTPITDSSLEVHDPEVLAQARAVLDACRCGKEMQDAVIAAVKRNEKWRGEQCINLLAPEAPTSPAVRTLLSAEVGTRAAEGHIGKVNRWFAGTQYIDEIESLCVELLKKAFRARYGNSRQGCESNGVKVPCRQLPDSDG